MSADLDPFRAPEVVAASLARTLQLRIAAAEPDLAALTERRARLEREIAGFRSQPLSIAASLINGVEGGLVGAAVGVFVGLLLLIVTFGR